jgi:CDGSH-type Zn-finger protein
MRPDGVLPDARFARVTVTDDGPVLVAGPVEVELPDGTVVRSERAVTALCVCRRSRRQPFCDTSHRRKARLDPGTDSGH